MDSQTKIFFSAIFCVGLVVLGIFLQPAIEERLAPELKIAWVAFEIAGSGVAEVGPAEIESGTSFTLHAVVEAEQNGEPVYYTQAEALRIHGQDVPAKRLRRWRRPLDPRVRWFTVEGTPPYLELTSSEELERFGFEELYRPDWPLVWSIPGTVEPARDDHLYNEAAISSLKFGVQRYHVNVEFYDQIDEMRPKKQVRSWRAEDLASEIGRFPSLHLVLPGRLAAASRVFGLTQIEVDEEEPDVRQELQRQIDELARKGFAFSRVNVIHAQLRATGKRLEDLEWRDIDLVAAESPWNDTAEPGDLMRVGERFVVLFKDQGEPGLLDYDDLCLDYAGGAKVRRLGEVFVGEGLVELASLAP